MSELPVHLLGIPMDLGAGRRGVDMGPSALRTAGIHAAFEALGREVRDLGDVPVAIPESIDNVQKYEDAGLVFLKPIQAACRAAVSRIREIPEEAFPIFMGGDHSVSMATVAGAALRGNPQGHRMGLLWVDAHADFNTPGSSPSGNVHGMPVAHLVGLGDPVLSSLAGSWRLRPEDIVMVGIRSVDPRERELLREHGVKAYTMREVDQLGISRVFDEAMERLSDSERLHVSFDADALDPGVTPGTGTTVRGGLSYREGHLLMELLAESGRVSSMDIVEVNPVLDTRNQTAEVMVEMAASLLGKRIL